MEQLWEVVDCTGRNYGTFARHAASDVLDQVWRDNPNLAWVEMREMDETAPKTTH